MMNDKFGQVAFDRIPAGAATDRRTDPDSALRLKEFDGVAVEEHPPGEGAGGEGDLRLVDVVQ